MARLEALVVAALVGRYQFTSYLKLSLIRMENRDKKKIKHIYSFVSKQAMEV
jgi:hypothetical protein